jgi:hypothetical protein
VISVTDQLEYPGAKITDIKSLHINKFFMTVALAKWTQNGQLMNIIR